MKPVTLFAIAGRTPSPVRLADATLVLIDYQNEYLAGPLVLEGAPLAVERASELLAAARAAGSAIVHVAHRGAPGGLFDPAAERGAFIAALTPRPGERSSRSRDRTPSPGRALLNWSARPDRRLSSPAS
jgi:nicotinamidase-related amidase